MYAAQIIPAEAWLLLGTETSRVLMLGSAETLNYNTGSPDTLPALTAAAVDGGGTTFDTTAGNWVGYTIQGSNVLSVALESAIPPTSPAAKLCSVTLQGVFPFPQTPIWVVEIAALTAPAAPAHAPTLTNTPGGTTLTAGTYVISITFLTADGETLMSPAGSIAIAAGDEIGVAVNSADLVAGALPAGVTGFAAYQITTSTAVAGYTPALYG